jgi:TonB family protein
VIPARAAVSLALALGLVSRGGAVTAQSPDSLLAAGRARVAARDLEGARTLLASAADSARGGTAPLRAESLMLLGLVHYYQGADSLARVAFASGLRLRPEARLSVQQSDPFVTQLLERERCRLAAADPAFTGTCVATGLTRVPEIDAMPALMYPTELRNQGIQGRVWVAVTVDTAGNPVHGSVAVAESPDSGFNAVAMEAVAGAHFSPGTVEGRVVRTHVQVPIDFFIGGSQEPDSALPVLPNEPAVDCLPDCPAGVTKPVLRSLLDLRSGPLSVGPTGAIDGVVTVDALIRQDGRVEPATARMNAQGVPVETGRTVFEAVRRARFDPALRDGQAVPARIRIRIGFVTPPLGTPRVDIRVL